MKEIKGYIKHEIKEKGKGLYLYKSFILFGKLLNSKELLKTFHLNQFLNRSK